MNAAVNMGAGAATPAGYLMRVALLGNPHCGKTALFNLLTVARQKVANYPGVTVERKEGVLHAPVGQPLDGGGRIGAELAVPLPTRAANTTPWRGCPAWLDPCIACDGTPSQGRFAESCWPI